jgi:hypothetical protein
MTVGATTIVTFEVSYHTAFGQVLYVVGAGEALGNWEPHSGLRLQYHEGGIWTGVSEFEKRPATSPHALIPFTFCVLNDHVPNGGVPHFEPGADRLLKVDTGASDHQRWVAHWGEGRKLQEETLAGSRWSGQLFRSPMPFAPMFDTTRSVMAEYRDAGVTVVVCLAGVDEMKGRTGLDLVGRYWEEGCAVIVHHIDDLHIPCDVAAFCRLVDRVHEMLMCGNRVVVHCHAGIGRTGILMACLATRHCGVKPSEAVATVRAQVRGAIQTDEQVKFITRASSTRLHPS